MLFSRGWAWWIRRTRWARTGATPHGYPIPARVHPRFLIVAALLPASVLLSIAGHQPLFATYHLALLVLMISDDVLGHQLFVRGMAAGRQELVDEMLDAWRENEMEPHEYLQREVWFGPEDA